MKTAVTIFLLVLVASSQTPLGQLLKLPILFDHFNKHKKSGGVSLAGFLDDHYFTNHNDADQTEDEQLPFKTVTLPIIEYAVLPAGLKPGLLLDTDIPPKPVLPGCYRLQQHSCSIFHPPRL